MKNQLVLKELSTAEVKERMDALAKKSLKSILPTTLLM